MAVSGSRTAGAGQFLESRSAGNFPLSQRIDLQLKHQTQIRLLQQGDVAAPAGTVNRQLLGELTVATGREVGLIRVENQRVLRLGGPDSINLADAKRVIAHTHPSGDLRFSGRLGGQTGDIPAFREFQPRQRSSVLIGPDGRAIRLPIPR